jgi:pyruvate dehydrogenase (quinone)
MRFEGGPVTAKTVAELFIERLIDWGVDTMFGLSWDGINGIFEALRTRQDKVPTPIRRRS